MNVKHLKRFVTVFLGIKDHDNLDKSIEKLKLDHQKCKDLTKLGLKLAADEVLGTLAIAPTLVKSIIDKDTKKAVDLIAGQVDGSLFYGARGVATLVQNSADIITKKQP